MPTLRDMLAKLRDQPDTLPLIGERVEEIIHRYSAPSIHPQFREDVIGMIASVLDLAENMSEQTYRLDEVFNDIADIQRNISTMMKHGILSRPRVVGFGLLNNQSGLLLPAFFYTQNEADNQLRILKDNGVISPITVVPAECVTSSILQPMEDKHPQLSGPLPDGASVKPVTPPPAPSLPKGATPDQLSTLPSNSTAKAKP